MEQVVVEYCSWRKMIQQPVVAALRQGVAQIAGFEADQAAYSDVKED